MKIISYKSIIEKLNLEALLYAPDGNVLTGYQVLNNQKILFHKDDETEISILPILTSELVINVEVVSKGKIALFENVKKDIVE